MTNAASYAAQFVRTTLGPYTYTVDAHPGVTVLSASDLDRRRRAARRLRHSAGQHRQDDRLARIFTPSITIDKVGSMTGPAPAPQTVTYTFYVRNGTDPTLPAATTALSNVTVTDDKCGSPTYAVGRRQRRRQARDRPRRGPSRARCTHPAPGTYHNIAVANGENILYGRPVPVVSPPDDWTVVLVARRPQVAVKPVAVNQAPCALARDQQHDGARRPAEHDPRARPQRRRRHDGHAHAARAARSHGEDRQERASPPSASGRRSPARPRSRPPSARTSSDLSVKPARRVVAQRAPRVTG